ncbi:MAG TPA: hypothetical protein VFR31_11460 [Thermoanaerobaculia bacterium]|nr:hypothetical protein [Thermoanaerobaculia bacterium]
MTQLIRRVVVTGLASILLALTAEGAEPAQQNDKAFEEAMAQREAIDEKSYEYLKHLPDKLDFALEADHIRKVAAKVEELGGIEVKSVAGTERLRLSDGQPSPIETSRLTISGRSPFGRVHVFLTLLQISTWRYAELEALHIRPEDDGTVRFDMRLAYPSYTGWPEEKAGRWRSPEDLLAEMVRKKQLNLDLLEDLAARSHFARLADALVALGLALEEKAVGLNEVQYDGKVAIKGFALGKSARDGLRPALEKAGFVVEDLKTSPTGSCQSFTVTARVKPAELSDEFAMGNGLFEHGTAGFCKPAEPAGKVTARGTAPADRALTLRLRGFEMIDFFVLLNELTSASFLLDDDVRGRISVDAEGATLEQVLAALGSAGLSVSPGPVRRVTKAGKPVAVPRPADYAAEPIDVSNRNSILTELLCVLGTVAERPILGPPDLRGAVRMYADDLRIDQVIEALVSAAGLVSVVDGDRLLLGPGTAAAVRGRKDLMNVCQIKAEGSTPLESRLKSLSPDLPKLAAGDLELSGLVRQGETWTAYAFTPTGKLTTLKAGERLSDASISSVGPDGVALATQGSETVKLALQP